jgi:hypothetical protein
MIRAPMLLGHNVIGFVTVERKPLREPAILTAMGRPPALSAE